MIDPVIDPTASLDSEVRNFVFSAAAADSTVPQLGEIAQALHVSVEEVDAALKRLAVAKVLILAPNHGDIWAANPFCAVPSGFRVETNGKRYWGICAWDALGIVAALDASAAVISAPCGDCGELLRLEFNDGKLVRSEGMIHFAVPAREWWKNIGFA